MKHVFSCRIGAIECRCADNWINRPPAGEDGWNGLPPAARPGLWGGAGVIPGRPHPYGLLADVLVAESRAAHRRAWGKPAGLRDRAEVAAGRTVPLLSPSTLRAFARASMGTVPFYERQGQCGAARDGVICTREPWHLGYHRGVRPGGGKMAWDYVILRDPPLSARVCYTSPSQFDPLGEVRP